MIRTFDDPILKTVCEPVQPGEDLAWLKDLEQACYANNGAGIAAPQIGIAKRAVFIRYGEQHGMVLVNPELAHFSEETETKEEGCLSYPGVWTPVERSLTVQCAWDLGASVRCRVFRGWEARVLQHEVDHLNGICRVGDAWRNPKPGLKPSMVAAAALVATFAMPR
jgi:peptide deformylase